MQFLLHVRHVVHVSNGLGIAWLVGGVFLRLGVVGRRRTSMTRVISCSSFDPIGLHQALSLGIDLVLTWSDPMVVSPGSKGIRRRL